MPTFMLGGFSITLQRARESNCISLTFRSTAPGRPVSEEMVSSCASIAQGAIRQQDSRGEGIETEENFRHITGGRACDLEGTEIYSNSPADGHLMLERACGAFSEIVQRVEGGERLLTVLEDMKQILNVPTFARADEPVETVTDPSLEPAGGITRLKVERAVRGFVEGLSTKGRLSSEAIDGMMDCFTDILRHHAEKHPGGDLDKVREPIEEALKNAMPDKPGLCMYMSGEILDLVKALFPHRER